LKDNPHASCNWDVGFVAAPPGLGTLSRLFVSIFLIKDRATAAADEGALVEASTRTTEDKWRPTGGENSTFNKNTKRRTGGPWEGKAQALTPPEAQRVAASGAGCRTGAATSAAATNEAAAGGCEGPIPKQAAVAAGAGALDGPSPFETTSAFAVNAGREAVVAGLAAKTTNTTTADMATSAAVGVRGEPSSLESPSAQPKHDPFRGTRAATAAATTNEAAAGCDGPFLKQDSSNQYLHKRFLY